MHTDAKINHTQQKREQEPARRTTRSATGADNQNNFLLVIFNFKINTPGYVLNF